MKIFSKTFHKLNLIKETGIFNEDDLRKEALKRTTAEADFEVKTHRWNDECVDGEDFVRVIVYSNVRPVRVM